jgi:hypothetical protein
MNLLAMYKIKRPIIFILTLAGNHRQASSSFSEFDGANLNYGYKNLDVRVSLRQFYSSFRMGYFQFFVNTSRILESSRPGEMLHYLLKACSPMI